jgi:hypothetical protein
MVGAEGFEVSFPSGRFALSFVEFKRKPSQNQRLPDFLGLPFFFLLSSQWTAFRKILVSLVSPDEFGPRLHLLSKQRRHSACGAHPTAQPQDIWLSN